MWLNILIINKSLENRSAVLALQLACLVKGKTAVACNNNADCHLLGAKSISIILTLLPLMRANLPNLTAGACDIVHTAVKRIVVDGCLCRKYRLINNTITES